MKLLKLSKKKTKNKIKKERIPLKTRLIKSQILGIWLSVIISLVFSSLSLFLGLKVYLDGEKEKCLINVDLIKDEYTTYIGASVSAAKGTYRVFNMMYSATITNISKNPINLVEYKTFGPFIRDYPSMDYTDFNQKNLKESFKEKSIKLTDPVRIDPGGSYKFDFELMVWTKIDLQIATPIDVAIPIDIMSLLESIYFEKTDFFGNKIDYETDKEDYLTMLSPPSKNSITDIKHHIILKTAKGNFLAHEIQWYNNSNLGLDIFYWVFDPHDEFKPSFHLK